MTSDPSPAGATPVVIGHRGAAAVAPENTLVALRAGLEAGATWIEFDVQLTADGHPVLLNPFTQADHTLV